MRTAPAIAILIAITVAIVAAGGGNGQDQGRQGGNDSAPRPTASAPPPARPLVVAPPVPGSPEEAAAIIAAARAQVGVTTIYDPAYARLDYPGGDVPRDRGVCTDVLIRALRDGAYIDLQLAVHRDMTANFAAYPDLWGLKRPDPNIDHRRVPNLAALLDRVGARRPLGNDPADFRPGDIVTAMLPGNLPHIMLISDRRNADGIPLVIHNIGRGTREEDALFAYPHTGHFRVEGAALAELRRLGQLQY
ncbi:DUF1287 domain-containing protein [Paracoccus sp. S1E-3]|uniref:DUF1287 domain-containing protein n=1 Tax=Paracoccus sp. S1E-3 TaxID=2756130 RepID=UPI0015EFA558|nr:DUF1287 domain-containing protein [Paracoccus sp. S1E-3]MBA4490068.1 DUF1287 domain-containing protein [Paracoccus sp. S1E-3]